MNFLLTYPSLIQFRVSCEALRIDVPTCLIRTLHLLEVAEETVDTVPRGLLAMTDEDARAAVADMAIREHQGFQGDTRGLRPGADRFSQDLIAELRIAIRPDLDGIIACLQLQLEKRAQPLLRASQVFGFTLDTKPHTVLELGDEKARLAFLGIRGALADIEPITKMRMTISSLFHLSPTAEEMPDDLFRQRPLEQTDYSVAFAAGDNWSTNGGFYIDQQLPGQIDWLAMAAGGLTVNTPQQVREKLEARRTVEHQPFNRAS